MRKYLSIYRNWRVHALTLLAMFAMLFLAGETDDITYFFFIKIVGFGLVCLCYRLGMYWNSKGKINELMELADEE